MLKNKSVETISSPEFINLEPCSDMVSKCQIKVLYVGKNRNGSYIDKETATKMANTLPTCPIVAVWREDKEDFGDHGQSITIENGEIKFSCKTRPYGFVAPDAKAWFQKFTDTDEFGNEIEHEYLMTEGYLWTGQFEEAKKAIEQGQPQSMELDNDSLDGHWSTDSSTGLDFFIINDAVFSKLCILGDDVEPCFEGASVTAAPTDYTDSSNSDDFTRTLFSMMEDLKEIISKPAEGGLNMQENEETVEEVVEKPVEDPEPAQEPVVDDEPTVDPEPVAEEAEPEQEQTPEPEFSLTALVAEVDTLRKQNASLREELDSLKTFKLKVENDEKDALIAKYFMLTDEDKADVVAHKAEYTLDEIESKLALAYVKKNVNFEVADDDKEKDEEPTLTFSLDDDSQNGNLNDVAVDPLIEALRDYRRENSTL